MVCSDTVDVCHNWVKIAKIVMDNGSKKVHQSMDTNWNTKSAEIRVKSKRIQEHKEAIVWDRKTNWSFLLSLLYLLKCNICGVYILNVHTVSRCLPPKHPVCPSFSVLASVYVTCTGQRVRPADQTWRSPMRRFLCVPSHTHSKALASKTRHNNTIWNQ